MKSAGNKFLIISGIYLFLISFALLSRGYYTTAEDVLDQYILFSPFAIVLGLIYVLKRYQDTKWHQQLFSINTLFWTTLLLVAVGFIFNFDYKQQIGCFLQEEVLFSRIKFGFSFTSIFLLAIGRHYYSSKFGISIFILEFFIWTFKALGFNCSLELPFPGYFTVTCWAIRMAIIYKLFSLRQSKLEGDIN
jgi:hypothetical protein